MGKCNADLNVSNRCDAVCCNDHDCLRAHDATYPKDSDGKDTVGWSFWLPPGADDDDDGSEFVCVKCWDTHGRYLARCASAAVADDG